jgi:molybdopterin guanine dinucleotide-containing S/N-oxide reductase-like protein
VNVVSNNIRGGYCGMSEQVFTNCVNQGPLFVYVRNGKIVRVRPIVFDETDAPSWKIEAQGRSFSPPRKAVLAPYVYAQRQQIYSEDRLLYPLKRIDWDPRGNRNTQNRGKSGYKRISWDEALDLVSGEMKRLIDQYGAAAIAGHYPSHHNFGNIGYHQSALWRFMNMVGMTRVLENTDSWEGWHWAAIDTWGFYWRLGMPEQHDLLQDGLRNSELIIYWSHDPDSTHANYAGQESAIWRVWLKELGKKQIFIDPFYNYTAATMDGKWIAPRPGTDASLAAAIAYIWLTDGTYDKDYIARNTIGFEQFERQILGKEDGSPKTPGWAAEITGVPARIITALAREWASKPTALGCGSRGGQGGACRQAYGTEWARMMVLLQAMQGLGKPGVSIWGTTMGAPYNYSFKFPGYADEGIQHLAKKPSVNPNEQKILRLLLADAILEPPVQFYGEGFCFKSLEQRFIHNTYPAPGYPEIRMYYREGGSFIGTFQEGNKLIRAYQSPKLECFIVQDCWWCTETGFADIILPACTNFERVDISEWAQAGGYVFDSPCSLNHRIIIYQHKCIEPLGESRSDYQIYAAIADRLGWGEDYTEGNTEEEWVRKEFEYSELPKHVSFEEFKKKGYFIVPLPEPYQSKPAFSWFYEGRECDTLDRIKSKGLATTTGKIEFVAQSLLKHFPDDKERPPCPQYIPSWEGHASELAKKYPLQLISPHPRYSFFTHYDTHTPWLWDIPGHRIRKDGYPYQTVRIHPSDAEGRGIRHGDVVRMHNDRGAVLGIACLTERVRPGMVHSYMGSSRYDPAEPGKPGSIDRGGCINLLAPSRLMSKNAPGMAPNSCLIEISKWEV